MIKIFCTEMTKAMVNCSVKFPMCIEILFDYWSHKPTIACDSKCCFMSWHFASYWFIPPLSMQHFPYVIKVQQVSCEVILYREKWRFREEKGLIDLVKWWQTASWRSKTKQYWLMVQHVQRPWGWQWPTQSNINTDVSDVSLERWVRGVVVIDEVREVSSGSDCVQLFRIWGKVHSLFLVRWEIFRGFWRGSNFWFLNHAGW